MPNENPMDKLRTLLNQVDEAIAKIPGLRVVNSGFGVVDHRGQPVDAMQISIVLDPEVTFAPVEIIPDDVITEDELEFRREQARFDAEFQNMITDDKIGEEQQEKTDTAAQIREQLRELRSEDGLGFDG